MKMVMAAVLMVLALSGGGLGDFVPGPDPTDPESIVEVVMDEPTEEPEPTPVVIETPVEQCDPTGDYCGSIG